MDRIIRAFGKGLVDRDQVLHRRNLRGQDHPVFRHAEFLGPRRRQQRRLHHGLAGHRADILRCFEQRVFVHQLGQQFLIQRTPIGADPNWFVVLVGDLDNVGELRIALVLEADIAGIDAVLVERLGASRIVGQQLVADIMEIADQGRGDAALAQFVPDMRHGGGSLVAIDRDSHQFGAGARQRCDLRHGARDIGSVGIGHRLHHDGRAAADGDIADHDLRCFMPGRRSGDVVLGWFDGLVHGFPNIRFW